MEVRQRQTWPCKYLFITTTYSIQANVSVSNCFLSIFSLCIMITGPRQLMCSNLQAQACPARVLSDDKTVGFYLDSINK